MPSVWLLLASCLFVVAGMGASVAQELGRAENFQRLKSVEIDARQGKILVTLDDNKTLTNGLRFDMRRGSLALTRIVVLYRNGQVHFEDQPIQLSTGQRTPVIDPRDEGLVVQEVELQFDPQASVESVLVDILGNAVGPPNLPKAVSTPPDPVHASAPTGTSVIVHVDKDAASLIRRVRVSSDGKLLAIGDDDGRVRIMDFRRFELLKIVDAHAGRIRAIDFSPDSTTLVTAGEDRVVRFWDLASGKQARKELGAPGESPYSLGLNPSFPKRFVLMGDRSGRLLAWDLVRDKLITDIGSMHQGPVHAVGYLPQGGGTYFSAGADGFVRIRHPMGQREAFKAHDRPIIAAGYSTSGRHLFTAGFDRTVRLWDAKKPGKGYVAEFRNHLKYILAADISPNEKLLASGGGDRAINVYDLDKKELIARLTGHTADVEAVVFTPDSGFIVSTSEDKSVRVWSVETKEEILRLFFVRDGDGYVGITLDNEYFGDPASSLLTIFSGERRFKGDEMQRAMRYLGRGAVIVTN